ncbi:MAG: serine/threonine-protein phosphatase [Gammaproteobacteria bacterium]|nr:serine/threonine-protein phosphatase [Gammaproteobacteria bacterium]
MQIEISKLSRIGAREENQDRVEVLLGDHTVLAMVIDGMGGHSAGAEAARCAVTTLAERFRQNKQPLPQPDRFLARSIGHAHDDMVRLGREQHIDEKPRATCAVCIVQEDIAFWCHLGDSRVYHIRDGKVLQRTRDHTHVELLFREGLIEESEINTHPMRSFVELCLGGEPTKPPVTISGPHALQENDVLFLCSDGLWGGVSDVEIAQAFAEVNDQFELDEKVESLVTDAIANNMPGSDNTSVAVLIWRGKN